MNLTSNVAMKPDHHNQLPKDKEIRKNTYGGGMHFQMDRIFDPMERRGP